MLYQFSKQKDLLKAALWSLGSIFILIFTMLLVASPKNTLDDSPITVKTMTIKSTPILQLRSFAGRIQSSDQMDLSFDISGQLIEYPIREGQNVEKGQILARLNPNEYQNTLEQDKTKFHQISTKYNRAKNLIKTNVISQNDFNNIEKDFETLKHRVDTSIRSVNNTTLAAPFSGQISRKFVKNYQYIQAKQPILSLQNQHDLEIIIDIPERVFAKTENTKNNLHFFATVEEFPGEKIPLKIKSYGTKSDLSLHTYPIALSLPKHENLPIELLPGMLVTVVAEYKSTPHAEKHFQIPLSAIWIGDNYQKYVWLVDPHTMMVHKRQIQVHPSSQQSMQVIQGLNKGDIIVTAGTHNLREGNKIKVYQSPSFMP